MNRFDPGIVTTVETFIDGVVKITKTHRTGANATAVIANTGTFVFVITRSTHVREDLHVSYLRRFDDARCARQKWLHLIGKLAQKPFSSKYFDNPIYSEHLINGNSLSDQDRDYAQTLADAIDATHP